MNQVVADLRKHLKKSYRCGANIRTVISITNTVEFRHFNKNDGEYATVLVKSVADGYCVTVIDREFNERVNKGKFTSYAPAMVIAVGASDALMNR